MDHPASAKSQIQTVVDVLLQSASDSNSSVADAVITTLRKISKLHCNDVVNVCMEFAKKEPKIAKEHFVIVLHCIDHVCQEYVAEIDGNVVITLIDFTIESMVQVATPDPQIQEPTSEILVNLGGKHCVQVVEALLKNVQVGVLPHHCITHTLGSLAAVNALGVVPYLKNILDLFLPLFAKIKLDYQKHALAYALGKFSEAIHEYASSDQCPDTTITMETFYIDIGTAFDWVLTNWLNTKDAKLTEASLFAIGSMFKVLSVGKISQQTAHLIPALLNLYKKHKEPLSVTQCLSAVIQVAIQVNGMLLEPSVASVLQVLGDVLCTSADYAQPNLLRNHAEVLRCYEFITSSFTDNALDFVILLLQSNHEKERVKALLILTHLTNACENAVHTRIKVLLQIFPVLIHDHNIRVKIVVLKTIVAFANKDFIPADLQEKYLEFIVKLCCKQQVPRGANIKPQELDDLQKTADNTLYMLSTSVSSLEAALWHLLLRCYLSNEYSEANTIILKCLIHLAEYKQLKGGCEDAFIRSLALLAQPLPDFLGINILNFLKNVQLLDNGSYRAVWDTKIPHLIKYLEQNYDNFNMQEWEELLFDFLNLFMLNVSDYRFSELLVLKAADHLSLYPNRPAEKWLLLKCLAIMVSNVQDETLINAVLEKIFDLAKLEEDSDIQACGLAIGISSRSHLKLIMGKLGAIRRSIFHKKQKLLNFSFMNNQKHEHEAEKMRLLILHSYTAICNEAPADALLQVVQSEILDFAVMELNSTKDFALKQGCLKAIGAVADAMHPNRNVLRIQMQDRNKILDDVLKQVQLHNGPEYVEMYPIIIPVITSLVRLSPILEKEQRLNILTISFTNIYNGSAIYCKINGDSNSPDSYYGELKMAPYIYSTFSKLNFLVKEILAQNPNPTTLDEIVSLLESWLYRKKAEQRLPALETLRDTLQTYLDNVKFGFEGPTTYTQSGFLVARITPRCFDVNKNIRKVAVDALKLILCITARYEGYLRDHDQEIAQSLLHVQTEIEGDSARTITKIISDLSYIIMSNLPPIQLAHFVDYIIDAFIDVESTSSYSSALVLNSILKPKGNEMQLQIVDLLKKLVASLDTIRCPRTRSTCLRCILSLAIHHPKPAVYTILDYPIPYETSVRDCWKMFSTDQSLTSSILDEFMKLFRKTPLYEPHEDSKRLITINLQPLQAICAMTDLFKDSQTRELCKNAFAELFVLFYTTLASYIETTAPATGAKNGKKETFSFIFNRDACKLIPADVCLDAFRQFALCCEQPSIAEALTGRGMDNFTRFTDIVPLLSASVCIFLPQNLGSLLAKLTPFLQSNIEPQRVAATWFFAAVVRHQPTNQAVISENVVEKLLSAQSDASCTVREVGLMGLGNAVEFLNWDVVQRHTASILNALMQGLDYSSINTDAPVTLEAMRGLSKFLKFVPHHSHNACQVTAAMRIKPLFEQEDVTLRMTAYTLFGDLAASINHAKYPETFKEQVCGNFISLLLHLSDDDLDVVKACKYSLKKTGPFLGSPEVNAMLQKHLLDEGSLHAPEFLTDLIKVMNTELKDLFSIFIMTCVGYFKSPYANIRESATFLTGVFYANMSSETIKQIPFDTVCYKLIQLFKDESTQVRIQAVQTISYLFA